METTHETVRRDALTPRIAADGGGETELET